MSLEVQFISVTEEPGDINRISEVQFISGTSGPRDITRS